MSKEHQKIEWKTHSEETTVDSPKPCLGIPKKRVIPNWVWESETPEDLTKWALVQFITIHRKTFTEAKTVGEFLNHPFSRIPNAEVKNAITAIHKKWWLPPFRERLVHPLCRAWADAQVEAWLEQNPFPSNPENFNVWNPKLGRVGWSSYTPNPPVTPNNKACWEELWKDKEWVSGEKELNNYLTNFMLELEDNPLTKLAVEEKRINRKILRDWIHIKKWISKFSGKPIQEIIGWPLTTPIGTRHRRAIILTKAIYEQLSGGEIRETIPEVAPDISKQYIGEKLLKFRENLCMPPKGGQSQEGRKWRRKQLEKWKEENPFPTNVEDFKRWAPKKKTIIEIETPNNELLGEFKRNPKTVTDFVKEWEWHPAITTGVIQTKHVHDWHVAQKWATQPESSAETLLEKPESPAADFETWCPIIKCLIKNGENERNILKTIRKKDKLVTVVAPTKDELSGWIFRIQEEIRNELPPAPPEPVKKVRKIPTIFGAMCGNEFANIPGWVIPEFQIKEGEEPPKDPEYRIWGKLLMYGILNFWNLKKIQRFVQAYAKENESIPAPSEPQLKIWETAALNELGLPELHQDDSRESLGYNRAVLLWKGVNKFPESQGEFSKWKPVGRDYSAFSFKLD